MLIEVGKAIEDGERCQGWLRGLGLVWLGFLNQCPYRLWHSSDQWSASYLELAGVDKNRVLTPAPVLLGDGIDGVVEGGTEALYRLSSDKGPLVLRPQVLDCGDLEFDLLRRADVALHAWFVRVPAFAGSDFVAERVDVVYAPSELALRRALMGSHGKGQLAPVHAQELPGALGVDRVGRPGAASSQPATLVLLCRACHRAVDQRSTSTTDSGGRTAEMGSAWRCTILQAPSSGRKTVVTRSATGRACPTPKSLASNLSISSV